MPSKGHGVEIRSLILKRLCLLSSERPAINSGQQTYDRNSMLNNLSQGLSLGFAGDGDEAFPAPPATVVLELLAGDVVGVVEGGPFCFNGDCEGFLDVGAE
jgi:hypothetical protein